MKVITSLRQMKRLKTYKEFRLSSKQLDKAIRDEEKYNKILHKYHQLQQLGRNSYILRWELKKVKTGRRYVNETYKRECFK